MSIDRSTAVGDENIGSRASTVSIPLTPVIRSALMREAKEEQRELTEHIQRVLAEHVIKEKLLEKEEVDRLQLTWRLVDRAVEKAKEICRQGGFSSDITLDAIKACMKEEEWVAGYRRVVQDDIYKNGNPRKGPINREMGFRIRAGIGGRIVKGANGKAAVTKVLGEIIQSFTPMESFDPVAVESKDVFRAD